MVTYHVEVIVNEDGEIVIRQDVYSSEASIYLSVEQIPLLIKTLKSAVKETGSLGSDNG